MECYKMHLYKRRTIIYSLLLNPVGIGLRGYFCAYLLKKFEKNLQGVIILEFGIKKRGNRRNS